MTAPSGRDGVRLSPGTERLTPQQKFAIRKMRELERKYGKEFLHRSLHQARFDYQELKRIAKGFEE
jgi:hypothetical protein